MKLFVYLQWIHLSKKATHSSHLVHSVFAADIYQSYEHCKHWDSDWSSRACAVPLLAPTQRGSYCTEIYFTHNENLVNVDNNCNSYYIWNNWRGEIVFVSCDQNMTAMAFPVAPPYVIHYLICTDTCFPGWHSPSRLHHPRCTCHYL